MEKKIEEAQREFNAILEYVCHRAMDREIHKVEESIYRMLLRLGRMLLEIFVLSMGTGKIEGTLVASDGSEYRYVGDLSQEILVDLRRNNHSPSALCQARQSWTVPAGRPVESSGPKVFVCPPGLAEQQSNRVEL